MSVLSKPSRVAGFDLIDTRSLNPAMKSWPTPARPSLTELLRFVREGAQTRGWRKAIDGLRPSVQRLWREASLEERRRFLRHLRPWLDIHRHRIAPEVATVVDGLEADGQLAFLAGRIKDVHFLREGGNCRMVPARLERTTRVEGPQNRQLHGTDRRYCQMSVAATA